MEVTTEYNKYKALRKGVVSTLKEYKSRVEILNEKIRNSDRLEIYSNYLKEERILKAIILDLENLI
jgi:hypothetical protein